MGKGPGPTALEQLFVANASETLAAPFKSTLTRFNIKTHEATTPIERTDLSSDTNFLATVAVYKGKVYVANSGINNDPAGSTVDVFNANTLELEQTWKTSQFTPTGVAAYKDNIYVTCTYADKDTEEGGNAVDVFPIDRPENKAGPEKSWETSQFEPVGVAAYEDNIYVTCAAATDVKDGEFGNTVDVFHVDTGNNGLPDKSWQTSQFGPVGVAAYKDNIYVTCANTTAGEDFDGNAVDVFHVDTGDTGGPDKSWQTSQVGPVGVAAYEENIYVTCVAITIDEVGNTINIFPVDAETGAEPSEIWKTDYGPGGIAAYNSLHPEGNLYIDSSGSNVV